MYRITDFTADHIERAQDIALRNYNKERGCVPLLPPVDTTPDLTLFAGNGLGVVVFDGGGRCIIKQDGRWIGYRPVFYFNLLQQVFPLYR